MDRSMFKAFFPVFLIAAVLSGISQASRAQGPIPTPPGGSSSHAPQQRPDDKSTEVPLSKKLDESDGVLTPPNGIDPKINKGPPAKTGDKMPVIIPPGEPGGDQSVQPK